MCRVHFVLCCCCSVSVDVAEPKVCDRVFWGGCVTKVASCGGLYMCRPCRYQHKGFECAPLFCPLVAPQDWHLLNHRSNVDALQQCPASLLMDDGLS